MEFAKLFHNEELGQILVIKEYDNEAQRYQLVLLFAQGSENIHDPLKLYMIPDLCDSAMDRGKLYINNLFNTFTEEVCLEEIKNLIPVGENY